MIGFSDSSDCFSEASDFEDVVDSVVLALEVVAATVVVSTVVLVVLSSVVVKC